MITKAKKDKPNILELIGHELLKIASANNKSRKADPTFTAEDAFRASMLSAMSLGMNLAEAYGYQEADKAITTIAEACGFPTNRREMGS